MIIKVSGRSALILATGLLVCFACSSSQAATGTDGATANDATARSKSQTAAAAPIALHRNLKHSARRGKSSAQAKSSALAKSHKVLTPAEDAKAAAGEGAADNNAAASDLPPTVANANAELPSSGAPDGDAKATPARTDNLPQAASDDPANAKGDHETLVVAADQLNDVDRALHEGNAPMAPPVTAPANPPAAPVMASSQESSTWDQTSLIGKIFIGFGAMLTMASAARMFMA